MSAGSPGSLPESVSVKAAQTITGDKTFSGTTTLSGTTALSGSVSGNISLSKESAHTVSVAASTTTDTAGGALTVLGLALFIGMAIGRGQGEKNARVAAEESAQQKLGLPASESADKLVLASGPGGGDNEAAALPVRNQRKPVEKFSSLEKTAIPAVPSVPETKSEIPLREDPLVAGPPKRKTSAKKMARNDSDDEAVEKPRKKKTAKATLQTTAYGSMIMI